MGRGNNKKSATEWRGPSHEAELELRGPEEVNHFHHFHHFLTAPSAPKMVGRLILLAIGEAAVPGKWTKMVRKWRENGFVRDFAELLLSS